MSYDNDVNIKLEDVNNSSNICFSMPIDYLWKRLSEEDLLEITTNLVSSGFLTKTLKKLIEAPALDNSIFSSTDKSIIEFKEVLISLIDELKESYVQDLEISEMKRWWSVGRSIERIVEIIFPEKKIRYSFNPQEDGFYIIDGENSDKVLNINLIDLTCSVNNEKVNGKDGSSYFYNIAIELKKITRERQEYLDNWIKDRDENRELKNKIKELEIRLSRHKKI